MREPPPDCEPDWRDDDWDIQPLDPRLRDLLGQGPSLAQLHGITDIPISQEYL